jgi:peptidoglycan-associated lipoprotein
MRLSQEALMTRNRFHLSLILIALVSACATAPEEAKPVPAPAPQATPAPASQPAPAPVAAAPAKPAAPAKATAPSSRSIYFDYDEYVIKPEFKTVLEAHAKYLRENPSVQGRIEGNADERGSREYNVALGQRRAEAVVRSLNLLGVPANRLEAVSWGEEKPRASGHDEASWWQNRRGDFVYKD